MEPTKLRVLHVADIHLGELIGPVVNNENARMLDTVQCMDFLAANAEDEKPDAILIAGDLFNKAQLWDRQRLKEIGIAAAWLRSLAAIAPTVLMFGTTTHENLASFANLRDMRIPNLHVVTTPELLTLQTSSGPLQVAAVPGIDKGYFRTQHPGMAPEEENENCSILLGDIILDLDDQMDPAIPSVLMGHYQVAGYQLDNGQHAFAQSEVTLLPKTLHASTFDLVCLGHIHRGQEVPDCGRPVFYAGALNAITFNEEGQDKGFWIHEMARIPIIPSGELAPHVYSRFIETPAREFYTLKADFRDVDDLRAEMDWQLSGISYDGTPLLGFETVGKIVRLHYQCTEEQRQQINHKAMEQLLYKGGAFYVAEIKQEQVVAALDKQEMNENSDPLANLPLWAEQEGVEEAERAALMELAAPLLATVSAKMPTGKISGVFEPKTLEVVNYRSYRREFFDFAQVFFAVVNGKNGLGKSSFFMDAMCDCLYEEPRTSETGGWITRGQTEGSITFNFGMGGADWRVIRTRSIKGAGKITLSLQECVDGKWKDRSGDVARDTQNKIVSLLGMDCNTFKCVALIMQDAYGLFMEADKGDRMEVLANILGLNVYEQLTELAKAKVTETNRALTAAKDKRAALELKLKEKPQCEEALSKVEADLRAVAREILSKEAQVQQAEEVVRDLTARAEKGKELGRQIDDLSGEMLTRKQEKINLTLQAEKAKKTLDIEESILIKAAELEDARQSVTVLKVKRPMLDEARAEEGRLVKEISQTEAAVGRLVPQIEETERLLAGREALEQAAAQYNETLKENERLDGLMAKDREARERVTGLKGQADKAAEQVKTEKQYLQSLKGKAEMLLNSDCLDSEKAACAFLADAKECREQIPLQEKLVAEKEGQHATLLEQVRGADEAWSELGYDAKEHAKVREQIKELRPKAEQAAQLDAKAELYGNLMDQKNQYAQYALSLADKLDEVRTSIQILAEGLKPLPALEMRIAELEPWGREKENLPAHRQAFATATERLGVIEQEIATKEDQRRLLDSERADCLTAATQLQKKLGELPVLKNQLKYSQEEQNVLFGRAGGLKAKLDALAKDAEDLALVAAEMEPTAKLLVRYQTLVKAFGFDGIPFKIVRSVIPELNAMANEILGQMTGGKMSLEIKPDRVQKSNGKEVPALEVWITDWRGEISYGNRSGGEKVKAALANAFALADLKARRAGIQLAMMFVDEPPFLDADGVEAYCDALALLRQRHQSMRVVAISHDPQMKARFPQEIDVVDAGEEGSKLRMAGREAA